MTRVDCTFVVNDSIRTGGETVMALEVERVLVQHPNVAECAVFLCRTTSLRSSLLCTGISEVEFVSDIIRS
jgi:non-ribosomal peptide synthetase component E (peptide arylation enzyme)